MQGAVSVTSYRLHVTSRNLLKLKSEKKKADDVVFTLHCKTRSSSSSSFQTRMPTAIFARGHVRTVPKEHVSQHSQPLHLFASRIAPYYGRPDSNLCPGTLSPNHFLLSTHQATAVIKRQSFPCA